MGEVLLVNESYPKHLLSTLQDLWQDERFCTVTLHLSTGEKFRVHPAVLVSTSNYLSEILQPTTRTSFDIEIQGISNETMRVLIDFMYSGTLSISPDCVQFIMAAAIQLDMAQVVSMCEEYVKRVINRLDQESGQVQQKSLAKKVDDSLQQDDWSNLNVEVKESSNSNDMDDVKGEEIKCENAMEKSDDVIENSQENMIISLIESQAVTSDLSTDHKIPVEATTLSGSKAACSSMKLSTALSTADDQEQISLNDDPPDLQEMAVENEKVYKVSERSEYFSADGEGGEALISQNEDDVTLMAANSEDADQIIKQPKMEIEIENQHEINSAVDQDQTLNQFFIVEDAEGQQYQVSGVAQDDMSSLAMLLASRDEDKVLPELDNKLVELVRPSENFLVLPPTPLEKFNATGRLMPYQYNNRNNLSFGGRKYRKYCKRKLATLKKRANGNLFLPHVSGSVAQLRNRSIEGPIIGRGKITGCRLLKCRLCKARFKGWGWYRAHSIKFHRGFLVCTCSKRFSDFRGWKLHRSGKSHHAADLDRTVKLTGCPSCSRVFKFPETCMSHCLAMHCRQPRVPLPSKPAKGAKRKVGRPRKSMKRSNASPAAVTIATARVERKPINAEVAQLSDKEHQALVCNICGQTFNRHRSLLRHVDTKHTGKRSHLEKDYVLQFRFGTWEPGRTELQTNASYDEPEEAEEEIEEAVSSTWPEEVPAIKLENNCGEEQTCEKLKKGESDVSAKRILLSSPAIPRKKGRLSKGSSGLKKPARSRITTPKLKGWTCQLTDCHSRDPFQNKEDLQLHMSTNHPQHWYKCPSCYYSTQLIQMLIRHCEEIHESKPTVCVYCQSDCLSVKDLKFHLKSSHEDFSQMIHEEPSEEIALASWNRALLLTDSHPDSSLKSIVLNHEQIRCPICQVVLNRKGNYLRHIRFFHFNIEYHCTICKSNFKNKYAYNEHVDRKHNGNVLVCQYCGKQFHLKSQMMQHVRMHENKLPYKCPFIGCERQFTTMIVLRGHMNSHTPLARFHCQFCSKSFNHSAGLSTHKKICKMQTKSTTDDGKRFKCKYCNAKFMAKSYLTEHIQGRHSVNKERYFCNKCGQGFTWRMSLQRHKYQCKGLTSNIVSSMDVETSALKNY